MTETNITRRRVMQGATAVGAASVFGSAVVTAQDGGGDGGGQGAAVRVAHLSPDAPGVNVRFNSADGGAGTGGGNQTDDNQTDGGDSGDEADVQIDGVGFRDVSSYNELDPGSYQVQVVPSEGGLLGGLLGDLFGGGEDEETVLYEDQIDVEEGTTYTVVAFGEVSQGPIPADDGGGLGGNATDDNATDGGLGDNATDGGVGDNATDDAMAGNESDGGLGDNESDGGLGDNESDGGLGDNETDAGTTGGADQGEQIVEDLSFGEFETVELDAANYSLRIEESAGAGGAEGVGDDAGGLGDNATDDNATDIGAGNESDGAATDGGVDVGDNETGDGLGDNESGGLGDNESDGGLGTDGAAQGDERGFQVQVLEDDISDPGDETARVRVFHAVPDVDSVSITALTDEELAQSDGQAGNETGQPANGTGQPGNGTGEPAGDGGVGDNQTGGQPAGQGQEDDSVQTASISTEGNTVYSGFASGYFDPEQAPQPDEDGEQGNASDGNDSDGGLLGDGDDNQTDDNQTGDGQAEGEDVAQEPDNAEFEFVFVEDAQGGERSDGGTGGLL